MSESGLFISLEGPEGSGKSTIIQMLNEWLVNEIESQRLNFSSVLVTREPGGKNNPLAESIRNIVVNQEDYEVPAITEAYLFAASRSAHVKLTILPALENKQIVISDRYLDSSIVYQGMVRGLGIDTVMRINQDAIQGIMPDLTLLLMVDPQEGLNRIHRNQRELNRLDKEKADFHQKIAEYYLQLYKTDDTNRIQLIDANQEIDMVFEQAKQKILEYLHARY